MTTRPAAPRASFLRTSSLLAAATLLGCALLRPPKAPPEVSPEQRRADYVAQHPELSPEIREAVLAGRLQRGMTRADVWAVAGREQGIAVASDSRYDTEITYRLPRTATVTDFDGPRQREYEVITGETVCILYFRNQQLVDSDCTERELERPVPVDRRR